MTKEDYTYEHDLKTVREHFGEPVVAYKCTDGKNAFGFGTKEHLCMVEHHYVIPEDAIMFEIYPEVKHEVMLHGAWTTRIWEEGHTVLMYGDGLGSSHWFFGEDGLDEIKRLLISEGFISQAV